MSRAHGSAVVLNKQRAENKSRLAQLWQAQREKTVGTYLHCSKYTTAKVTLLCTAGDFVQLFEVVNHLSKYNFSYSTIRWHFALHNVAHIFRGIQIWAAGKPVLYP